MPLDPDGKITKIKKNCVNDVKYTIKNILKKAERMKFASVAIPSISAGTNFKLYNSTWVNLFIKILSVIYSVSCSMKVASIAKIYNLAGTIF